MLSAVWEKADERKGARSGRTLGKERYRAEVPLFLFLPARASFGNGGKCVRKCQGDLLEFVFVILYIFLLGFVHFTTDGFIVIL